MTITTITLPANVNVNVKYAALKGGAARSALRATLFGTYIEVPRDLDYIETSRPAWAAGNRRGDDVELVGELADALVRRDFTVNEVYATSHEVVATTSCVEDTCEGVLRPSQGAETTDRLVARACGFAARYGYELVPELEAARLELVNRLQAEWPEDASDTFNVALVLRKAWDTGALEACSRLLGLQDGDAALAFVERHGAPDMGWREALLSPCLWEDFESLPAHAGMGRRA